jgi:tripartite-type tricarboxylate transporter receptor subunit TctC
VILSISDDFGEGNAMKPARRTFLHLAAGAAALSVVPRLARAQTYPTRPVRIVVPFAAGGTADILGRLWGQWLSERLGQQFIIDNRAGAATNTGTETVVRAPADGYTLLLITPPNVVNVTLYENLNFNFIRDITPVASVSTTPGVVVVNPRFPAKTIPEFIAYARANPGRIAMATQGSGGSAHIYGEMFKQTVGVDMVAVPYRGEGPALTDLMGGQVQVMFAIMPSAIEYIRAGTLRALAVTDVARAPVLPDIPAVNEFVPGYQAAAFQGFGAPKSTPAEIVNRLNTEINALLADPKVKARLADLGSTVLALSPADFGKLIVAESEKWGKVIRAANIKPE